MKKILGIGNALVDVMVRLDSDNFLKEMGLPKGSMQLIDTQFAKDLQGKISDFPKSISAGGSAANTINGLANLGVETGFIGVVGKDAMGKYFSDDMLKNKITPHLTQSNSPSGVATAFVTPDSERTFATYLGAAMELNENHLNEEVFKLYDIIHIEGYLVQNYDLVKGIMKLAKKCGLKIALDLASYNVVESNLDFIKSLVNDYVDIVFANEEEAKAFTGLEPHEALDSMALSCELCIVKLGSKGSIVKMKEQKHIIDIVPSECIDTTGAGDMYAAGFLYGLINNYTIDLCGKVGSLLAGKVIQEMGSKIQPTVWNEIKKEI
ncbi:MAG: putative sugar kinase YdjH [Bacteroidetes bacterium ADurb.Bin408]|nr:MAG: putative sugar kinase YdjH [Bacteroidetes bacterium ADurb.Bin408]